MERLLDQPDAWLIAAMANGRDVEVATVGSYGRRVTAAEVKGGLNDGCDMEAAPVGSHRSRLIVADVITDTKHQ